MNKCAKHSPCVGPCSVRHFLPVLPDSVIVIVSIPFGTFHISFATVHRAHFTYFFIALFSIKKKVTSNNTMLTSHIGIMTNHHQIAPDMEKCSDSN